MILLTIDLAKVGFSKRKLFKYSLKVFSTASIFDVAIRRERLERYWHKRNWLLGLNHFEGGEGIIYHSVDIQYQ